MGGGGTTPPIPLLRPFDAPEAHLQLCSGRADSPPLDSRSAMGGLTARRTHRLIFDIYVPIGVGNDGGGSPAPDPSRGVGMTGGKGVGQCLIDARWVGSAWLPARPFVGAQGERNSPPQGFTLTLALSRLRRTYSPSRDPCVAADLCHLAICFSPAPPPRSYFECLSTSGPGPSSRGYAKVSSRERG